MRATSLIVMVVVGLPGMARAESVDQGSPMVEDMPGHSGLSIRSLQSNWMVLPRGEELGFNLRFVTAPDGPQAGRLRFSDLVVGRLHARTAIAGGRAELYG